METPVGSFGMSAFEPPAVWTESPGTFPEKGRPAQQVLEEVNGFFARDYLYSEGRVFNSISSQPLPIAVEAFIRAIQTNMGDNRIFPGLKPLENETVSLVGDLLGHRDAVGNVISGATEGNLLALYVAKLKGEEKGIQCPEVVVPFSGHFSLDKVASLLGIKLIRTSLDERQRADVQAIESAVGPNTIAIVATAGTSEFGAIDPIREISRVARAHDVYFHVDAASGGFLIPFFRELGYPAPEFGFEVEGVDSVTVDPHKYGLSVIPSGIILFRSIEHHDRIRFDSHYVGTFTHRTILGTRTGAGAASAYAVIKYLGREGFKAVALKNLENRQYLLDEAGRRGLKALFAPELLIVAFASRNPAAVVRGLEERGWLVSLTARFQSVRIVLHHHITKQNIHELLDDWSSIEESLI